MSTIAACPNCQQRLRLRQNPWNSKARCPKCKKIFDWTPRSPGAESPYEWPNAETWLSWLIGGAVFVSLVSSDDFLDDIGAWGLIVALVLALITKFYAVGFIGVAFEILSRPIRYVSERRLQATVRRAPCPHGVPGGSTASQCPQCVESQQRQIARAAQQAKIRKDAQNLSRKESRRLTDQIRRDCKRLREISPRTFENIVSKLFRKMGYSVRQTPYTNDRGRDAIARKGGKDYVIECKRYARDTTIGRRDLQILHSAMTEEAAAGGFFVTTGKFAKTAKEFVEGKKIELVDAQHLVELMRHYMPYDSQEADRFRVMCEKCGNIVKRRLSRPEEIVRCVQGHQVSSAWTVKKFIDS